MTVYGYLRVSNIKTHSGEIYYGDQFKIISDYCREKKLKEPIFIDDRNVSGKIEFRKRREGKKLFKKLENGDVIVVSHLHRMFRSPLDTVNVLNEFVNMNVSFHVIHLGGDLKKIEDLFFNIVESYAKTELDRKKSVSQKIKKMKKSLKDDGKYFGGKIKFGYKVNEDGEIVEDEKSLRILDEIKNLRRLRFSYRKISKILKDELNVKLSYESIRQIIQDGIE